MATRKETAAQRKRRLQMEFLYGKENAKKPMYQTVFATHHETVRHCEYCGKPMYEGFCIENGAEYYCSEECLHKHLTEEEYENLYDDGNGDSYWTSWLD